MFWTNDWLVFTKLDSYWEYYVFKNSKSPKLITLFKFLSSFCFCSILYYYFESKLDKPRDLDWLFSLSSSLRDVFNLILRFWIEIEFFLACNWLLETTANTFFYLFWNSFILLWHLQRFEHLEWDWIYISSFLAATCFIIISLRKLKAVSFKPNVLMKFFNWKSIQAELLISVRINFSDPCLPTFISTSNRCRPVSFPLYYCLLHRLCINDQF